MNGRLLDDATASIELRPDGIPDDYLVADGAPLEGIGAGVQGAASGAGTGLVGGAVIPRQWYTPAHARKRRLYGKGAGRQAPASGRGRGWVDDAAEILALIA